MTQTSAKVNSSDTARDTSPDAVRGKSLATARDKTVDQLREEVEMILKEIRPYVNSHGGDVKLVEVTPTSVKLRIEGTCVGCSLSEYTYGVIVEEAIREYIPQITNITYA